MQQLKRKTNEQQTKTLMSSLDTVIQKLFCTELAIVDNNTITIPGFYSSYRSIDYPIYDKTLKKCTDGEKHQSTWRRGTKLKKF